MTYSLSTLCQWLKAPAPAEDRDIVHLLTDSRHLLAPAATLFIALDTASNSGRRYVAAMAEAGVKAFIVRDDFETVLPAEIILIRVSDTLEALQTLASRHRAQLTETEVVGITGSNGKTIVKEWLNQLLHTHFSIGRSPRSYNSQVGVPLSLWGVEPGHQLALIEAGISQSGEMERLEKMIRPQTGILTGLGDAHSSGFGSAQDKLAEKCILFAHCKTLIVHRQSFTQLGLAPETFLQDRIAPDCRLISIGQEADNTLSYALIKGAQSASLQLSWNRQPPFTIGLQNAGDAHVQNLLTCAAFLLHKGLAPAFLQEQLPRLQPLDMRLQLVQGRHGIRLINDSYSNDLRSLETALQYLHSQAGDWPKLLVLSDIVQSDLPPARLYQEVAKLLRRWPVQHLVLVGEESASATAAFEALSIPVRSFPGTAEVMEQLSLGEFAGHFILLKGARKFAFEQLVQAWQLKAHQTVVEVNLNALEHNLRFYRSLLKPETRVMAMVKAFGYGTGGAELARLLVHQRVDYLAVAYADEAVELRQAGIHLPMMVMNVDTGVFPLLVEYELEPEIFSPELLHQWLAFAGAQGLNQHRIHLKLDTGMHRLGFQEGDIDELGQLIAQNNYVQVKSVFSHFAASEDAGETAFTQHQFTLFQEMATDLENALGYGFLRHISNSGGIGLHPQFQLDMVRLGIGLYGVDSSGLHQHQLQPAMAFYTTVSQVHRLKQGDTVGYNRRGVLHRDSVVATIRAGYADGYPRSLGHGVGHVFINGRQAPVLGTVCMDMLMIDVTDLAPVQPGDRAELFGAQVPVQEMARAAGTIAYEILTGIGQRVQRVYVRD